jgi:hemolysin III
MGIVAVSPLVATLGSGGTAWLVAGGVLYTAGIVFYVYDERVRHFHGIWHLFVLGGSASHWAAVALYMR